MKPSPFGKYLLLERIAIGGMAEVFLAKSFGIEGFERILAIKRILPQLAEDKAFIGMFIDEARIAGGLSHANITPIYELGKVGSAHYIAMEHVWGKDLLQIMNRFRRLRARMPAGMVAFIGARMCEALDYAHHKRDAQGNPIGLIHRDVSPQNVLVSYDGAVKLIDFGVAKAKSRTTKTQAGVVKGKFGYMSPEQVRGKKIDHRSDIFALGTCLYEMLTLERLFAEETDFATMEKIRRAKLPKPSSRSPGVPAALDDVVMRALTKDPAKRYESAAEVQEALTRIVMTEEPRLSTATLAEWMHNAFAEEMLAEKSRLDTYAAVKLRDDVLGEPSSGRRLLLESTQNGRPPSLIPPSDSGSGEAQDETM
ncbi:MAG: serine/threonine protein kinase, partial [Polyangiaceae bacterium]|nr:serine/threonine protein kinase [Polyangiaceae bacterium]